MTSRTCSSVSKQKYIKVFFKFLFWVFTLPDLNLIIIVAVGKKGFSFLPITGANVALLLVVTSISRYIHNTLHAQLFPGTIGRVECHDAKWNGQFNVY